MKLLTLLDETGKEIFINCDLIKYFEAAVLHTGTRIWFAGDDEWLNVRHKPEQIACFLLKKE